MIKPEVLAPAGNFDTLKVAIANGADAVYLGIDEFNARGNIQNFTLENLKEVVSYSHLFGVKIYLTLNILLKDDEFDRAIDIITQSSSFGVDAYIIQDIGLYYMIKKTFPNLEIHASTQMGLQNLEGAKFAKSLGFKRVVLARETSLEDIKKIRDNIDVEIEYFVQGALCVSFSGNCYLCSLLAGASGNRGKCKQFCRLPYLLDNGQNTKRGYLLSTKDFCMVPRLKDLFESGVTSFKIEGRARRAGYVGESVKTYREIVDNNFKYSQSDIENLKKVYNRGDYISGYFDNQKIIYSKAQNHIGIKIGYVEGINKGRRFNEIKVFSSHNLIKGDSVKFFVDDEEVGIIAVNDVKQLGKNHFVLTSTNVVPLKAEMRLIVDSQLEEKVIAAQKQLLIDATFVAKVGQKARLEFTCGEVRVKVESEEPLEKAKTSAISYDECFRQFEKVGNEFKLEKLDAEIEDVFMAKSMLNNLRRDAIQKLKNAIVERYSKLHNLTKKSLKTFKNEHFFDKSTKKMDILAFSDFEKLNEEDIKKDLLIYKPSEYSLEKIKNEYEKYGEYNVYLSLPIIASQSEVEKLKEIANVCEKWGVVANNYYALDLKEKSKVIIGEGLNVFNSYAVKFYCEQGYDKIIISNEVENDQQLHNCGATLMCYQNYFPEYMTFKHCPIKENIGGNCANCMFKDNYVYKLNSNRFSLVRRKINACQFALKALEKKQRSLKANYSAINEIM